MNSAQQAIEAALNQDWQKALDINKEILKKKSDDIDALNRIARVYFEMGMLEKARKYSQKALTFDSINPIAKAALAKYRSVKTKDGNMNFPIKVANSRIFIEEPGRTKIIQLIRLGDPKYYLVLNPGCEVMLSFGKHLVSVETGEGKLIGRLPDDLSRKLIEYFKKGNKYKAFIKCTKPEEVKILMREEERCAALIHTASFPIETRSRLSDQEEQESG
jgi:tetratricopeptide (TPR) repeat protein